MVRTAYLALVATLALGVLIDSQASARPGAGAGAAGAGARPGAGAGAAGVGARPGVGVGAPGVGVVNPVARAVVATGRYIAVLPAGCVAVTVGGAALQQCGSTYYRAHGAQYEVVTVK